MGLKVITCHTRILRGFDKVAFYDVSHARLANILYGNEESNRKFREYLSFVKEEFSDPNAGDNSRMIFSSRPLNIRRSSKAMLDVEARYLDRGYERVDFSTMSMSEQVKVMSQATHFAGFHGANLVNLVFTPSGCKIYELYVPGVQKTEAGSLISDNFKKLSNELGMEYHLAEVSL